MRWFRLGGLAALVMLVSACSYSFPAAVTLTESGDVEVRSMCTDEPLIGVRIYNLTDQVFVTDLDGPPADVLVIPLADLDAVAQNDRLEIQGRYDGFTSDPITVKLGELRPGRFWLDSWGSTATADELGDLSHTCDFGLDGRAIALLIGILVVALLIVVGGVVGIVVLIVWLVKRASSSSLPPPPPPG